MMIRKVALLLALAPVANAFVGSSHPQGRLSETAIQAGGYLDKLSRGPPPPPSPLPYGNNEDNGNSARPMDPNMNHPTEYSSSPNTNNNRRPAAIGAPFGNGLMNGGTGGSTNLPGQYGQVDHTRPYGNCRPDWDPSGHRPTNGFARPPRVSGPLNSSNGNQNARPTTGFVRPAISGPLNGGTGGSTNLPGQYSQVDHTSPYGNCRPKDNYQQQSQKGAQRPVSGFTDQDYQNRRAPPMNGGTSGSARMADPYGPVDHTSPY